MALPVTTGLHAHYDADAITGLANNDPVQTWTDLAGISNATQPGAGKRPLYITDGLNGRPVLRFDGVDDWMESLHATQFQPLTAFVVGHTSDASSATQRGILGLGSALIFGTPYYGSGTPLRRIYGGSFLDGSAADTDPHLFRFVFNGASSQIAVDGVVEGSGNAGTREGQRITPGVDRNGGVRYHQGDIAEIVVYSRTLTTQETTDVEDYLTAKWFGAAPTTYTLGTSVVGSGSITLDPPGGTYDENEIVAATAVPSTGWTFDGWSGDLTGTTNPDNVTMDANKTITATFTEDGPTYTAGRHYSTDGGQTWTLFQAF